MLDLLLGDVSFLFEEDLCDEGSEFLVFNDVVRVLVDLLEERLEVFEDDLP